MKGDEPKPVRCPLCRKKFLNGAAPSKRVSSRSRRRIALRNHLLADHPNLHARERSKVLDRALRGASDG